MKKISIFYFISIAFSSLLGGGTAYASTINICPNNGNCQNGNMYAKITCSSSGEKRSDIRFSTTDAFDGWHSDSNTYGSGPKNFMLKYTIYINDYPVRTIEYNDHYRCGGALNVSCDITSNKMILDCAGNKTFLDMQ